MKKILPFLLGLTVLLLPFYEVRFTLFYMPFSLPEIVAWISIGIGAQQLLTRTLQIHKSSLNKHRVFLVTISLIVVGVVLSTLFSTDIRAGLGVLKAWVIAPILFIFTIHIAAHTKPSLWHTLFALYFYSATAVCVVALMYFANGALTYDGRLQAFYASPNMLALYCAPALFYIVTLRERCKEHKTLSLSKAFHSISVIVIITAIYLTQSYAAWGALLIAIVLMSMMQWRKKQWIVVSVVIACTILLALSQVHAEKVDNLFTHFERSSLNSRLIIWRSALHMITDNAIVGIGPNQFQQQYLLYQKYYPPYLEWAVPQPHNLYLAFYLHAGIVGLIGFLGLCGHLLWRSFFIYQKTPLRVAAIGALLVMLLHGLLDTPYWKGDLAFVFWLIVGVLYFSHKEGNTIDRDS